MSFKELRVFAGFDSRDKLAQCLGTKRYNIDKWESGKSMPKSKDIRRVAETLGVTVEQLLECFA